MTKELGARDVIQHGGMAALVGSLEDPQPAVRDAAYGALVEAARFDPARRALENMQARGRAGGGGGGPHPTCRTHPRRG